MHMNIKLSPLVLTGKSPDSGDAVQGEGELIAAEGNVKRDFLIPIMSYLSTNASPAMESTARSSVTSRMPPAHSWDSEYPAHLMAVGGVLLCA